MADIEDILKERGGNYGPFPLYAEVTQEIKETIRRHLSPRWKNLSPTERAMFLEALDMIAHKIGRIVNGDPRYADSWVDIEGYARLPMKFLGSFSTDPLDSAQTAMSGALTGGSGGGSGSQVRED